MKTYIYVLKCPLSKEIKYVGKSNNPDKRYKNHINKCRDKNTHKRNWISKLKLDGLKPELETIDCVDVVEWKYWEKFYITKFLNEGCKLVNCTDGGDGSTFGNKTSFKKGDNSISVVCLDLEGNFIGRFDTITEAALSVNKANSGIVRVLNGSVKTCGNLIWLKEEIYISMNYSDIQNYTTYINTLQYSDKSKDTQFKKGLTPWNKNLKY
jgi:hypothetical protein